MADAEKAVSAILRGSGGAMPALGLGTWDLRGDAGRRAVLAALEAGYRHIDTAEMYGNEKEIGDALRQSSVQREEVFLVTKVWPDHLHEAGVRRALDASLQRLQTDYVDLYLIHWPNAEVPLAETLGVMAELREIGRVRRVGVSNFTVEWLQRAEGASPAPIFCNQVEYHPYLSQKPVLDYCVAHEILVVAYCPLARGRAFEEDVLRQIGAEHGKSPGQVALRWLIQQPNVGAIPRSSSPEHIRENLDVFDFELDEDEMERIFGLQCGRRLVGSAGGVSPDWDT